jgi:hypothetical protein
MPTKSLSTQCDILGTGQTTTEHVTLGAAHTHILSSLRDSLNGSQGLCHTLGLVSELQEQLLTEGGPLQGRTDCALRPRNRATTTRAIQNKVVQVVSLHELKNGSTVLVFAFTDCLDLCLECADLIIGSDPGTKRLADLVGVGAHLRLIDFFLESFFRLGVR